MNIKIPSNFTLAETVKFLTIPTEIVDKIEGLAQELEDSRMEAKELYRDLELSEEKVYTRDVFIETVLQELDQCKTYRNLAKAIRIRFEESGIEY